MQFAIHYAELAELDVPVLRVDSSVLRTRNNTVCRRVTKYRARLREGCADIFKGHKHACRTLDLPNRILLMCDNIFQNLCGLCNVSKLSKRIRNYDAFD